METGLALLTLGLMAFASAYLVLRSPWQALPAALITVALWLLLPSLRVYAYSNAGAPFYVGLSLCLAALVLGGLARPGVLKIVVISLSLPILVCLVAYKVIEWFIGSVG